MVKIEPVGSGLVVGGVVLGGVGGGGRMRAGGWMSGSVVLGVALDGRRGLNVVFMYSIVGGDCGKVVSLSRCTRNSSSLVPRRSSCGGSPFCSVDGFLL